MINGFIIKKKETELEKQRDSLKIKTNSQKKRMSTTITNLSNDLRSMMCSSNKAKAIKGKIRREHWIMNTLNRSDLDLDINKTTIPYFTQVTKIGGHMQNEDSAISCFNRDIYFNGAIPLIHPSFHKFRDDRPSNIKEIIRPFINAYSKTNPSIERNNSACSDKYNNDSPHKTNYLRNRITSQEIQTLRTFYKTSNEQERVGDAIKLWDMINSEPMNTNLLVSPQWKKVNK